MTVPWSSKPNAAITTLRVSLHQAQPEAFGFSSARSAAHPTVLRRRGGTCGRPAAGADRRAEAVEPARLAGDVGAQAFARRDAVPAAGDDGALVFEAERRHHDVARLVAPGEASGIRLLRG